MEVGRGREGGGREINVCGKIVCEENGREKGREGKGMRKIQIQNVCDVMVRGRYG